MGKNEEYFKLHVDEEDSKHQKDGGLHEKAGEKPHTAAHNHRSSLKKNNKIKEIFQDTGRHIIASIAFFVVGFILLNWSAYSQIIQLKWDQLLGRESPLTGITETTENAIVYNQDVLKTSSDPEIQKKQIPDLDLEIAPTDNRIIIPRINKNIPIIRVSSANLLKHDWSALEKEIQSALRDGVVHYPGTSLPGQSGNTVITGHSSYFPWDPGRFKDVFALLHDLVIGDRIVVYHEQDKYLYEVTDIKVVLPDDISVLKQTPDEKLTLITCTPVGTNLKRLIVVAEPIAINNVPLTGENQVDR